MIDLSIPERKELVLKLNGELEKLGFKTSWHSDTEFQVEELPIPKIVPFDTAKLSIRVEEYGIYFEISILFTKVMENVCEAEEFNNIVEQNNNKWVIKLMEYFNIMDPNCKLKWDTEYQDSIENSLYGLFDSADDIVTLTRSLKELIDKKWLY